MSLFWKLVRFNMLNYNGQGREKYHFRDIDLALAFDSSNGQKVCQL
jgi:hypothetical protein